MDITLSPSHVYTLNGSKVPSVTQITGMLPKDWMGPWVAKEISNNLVQFVADAHVAKSLTVTTLLSAIDNAKSCWNRKASKAASHGTKAHAWIEKFIATGFKEQVPDIPEVANAVNLFLKWLTSNEVEWLHSEVKVGSEFYGYCGKFDAVAKVNGKVTMIDFKTSGNIHEMEYAIQLAGYQIAYDEMRTIPKIERRMILWIPKEGETYKDHYINLPYEDCKRAFLGALEFHKALGNLDKHIIKEVA